MFFSGFETMYESVIMAILLYFSIIIIVRLSGKRTLSDLNAFDLLVTITMGSIAATTILSKNTRYLDGVVTIIVLVALQYIVAKVTVYSKTANKLVRANPTLLFYDGEYIEENLKKMRITKNDILQQARIKKGVTSNGIKAVILEANGKMSIMTNSEDIDEEGLRSYM